MRAHIGRLRQRLEAELDDEWFLWTDISASPGYPIGMGAVIHCSLAQYISKIELPCSSELNKEVWTGAVEGRLMQLEVTRQELPKPWRFIGIYQHVDIVDESTYITSWRRQFCPYWWTVGIFEYKPRLAAG